ncbi:MAG TPA: hypothetical protein PK771_11315, partial [Spirochaetota bacterium]|nr:hypothetical protein [Spirochaetota bacterium]
MSNEKLFKKFIETNNKTLSKSEIDLEKVLIEAITDSLTKQDTHNLGSFGYIKKTTKMVEGKSVKNIDFFGNDDLKTKIFRNFKKNKDAELKLQKNKKMFTFISIPVIILLFLVIFFLLFKFGVINFGLIKENKDPNLNKIVADVTNDISKNNHTEDNTKDFVIYEGTQDLESQSLY